MKKLKKTKKMMARTEAIELFANNVKIDNKTVAEQVGISAPTLRYWLSDPDFSEALYKRYMEIAGVEIPAVVQAMIEEAKLGNVQAGKLILEHFGKLVPKLDIQVSNFEKFISAEEAEFLVAVVNKKVNNKYKGFTANLVKEAFDWDENFMKKE